MISNSSPQSTSCIGKREVPQTSIAKNIAKIRNYTLGLFLSAWLITGRVSAQTGSASRCSGSSIPAMQDLGVFIGELHAIAFEIAFPAAGLLYAWAGLNWMSGTAGNQRTARRRFVNTTIGLTVVILSDGFVSIVSGVFCGGGA